MTISYYKIRYKEEEASEEWWGISNHFATIKEAEDHIEAIELKKFSAIIQIYAFDSTTYEKEVVEEIKGDN